MTIIRNALLSCVCLTILFGCSPQTAHIDQNTSKNQNTSTPKPPPWDLPVLADSFAYPIGNTENVTQAMDGDEWYNALDFGANDHLGEDWNKNSGGSTDCGEPVYAAAWGKIVYADDAGPGWGNVIIVEHQLTTGRVETLYGHLQEILETTGKVQKREQIGKIGNANGRYSCHLHFELRSTDSPMWHKVGGGYAKDRKGWLDPSDFIDKHR